jgi:hypothetical protein
MYILNRFIIAPHIGMGRGVLDLFSERAQKRLESQTFEPAIERPGAQLRFAEASCELDSRSGSFTRTSIRSGVGAKRGYMPTDIEQAELRRNITYGAKLVSQATHRLVDGIDSSGLKDENLIHRQAADTRGAGLQVVLHWEEMGIQYARVHWGLDPQTVLF